MTDTLDRRPFKPLSKTHLALGSVGLLASFALVGWGAVRASQEVSLLISGHPSRGAIADGLVPVAAAAVNSPAAYTSSLDPSAIPQNVGVALVDSDGQRCAVAFIADTVVGKDVDSLGLSQVVAVSSDGIVASLLDNRRQGCLGDDPQVFGWMGRDGFHPAPLGRR